MKLGEVLESDGRVPLPPYIKREADASDLHTYQTAHAVNEGSVAAPTAGLHFSESLFSSIKSKGSKVTAVTLHVGAGTFKPMDSDDASKHEMHGQLAMVPCVCLEVSASVWQPRESLFPWQRSTCSRRRFWKDRL
mmetsp:Transcript_44898/g.70338  ORF Transcript_44898/g.70338 Transcript_44898/m.70338 type:complete len:135 (+) Transcript_44898:1020-1424(+)